MVPKGRKLRWVPMVPKGRNLRWVPMGTQGYYPKKSTGMGWVGFVSEFNGWVTLEKQKFCWYLSTNFRQENQTNGLTSIKQEK